MPRRVIQALVILTLLITAASPSAVAAAVTVSTPLIDVQPRFQEEGVADEAIA
jgi:hypothetical protein